MELCSAQTVQPRPVTHHILVFLFKQVMTRTSDLGMQTIVGIATKIKGKFKV